MSDPTIVLATVRDGGEEWHIECRLSDGQKGAFIIVDRECEWLADRVAQLLNENADLSACTGPRSAIQ